MYTLTNPTPNGVLTAAALAFSMLGGKGDLHVQITYGEERSHHGARCPDARRLHASDLHDRLGSNCEDCETKCIVRDAGNTSVAMRATDQA
jgi:hypothetical protein